MPDATHLYISPCVVSPISTLRIRFSCLLIIPVMPKDCKNCKICRLNQLYILNHNSRLQRSEPIIPSTMRSESKLHGDDRRVRLLAVWLWFPALAILLPHGILTKQFLPAIGTLPVTLSAMAAIVNLLPSRQKHGKDSRGWSFILLSDLFLALSHISILIPTWITISEYHCNRGSWSPFRCTPRMVMLGTTGSMFLIINL